MSKSLTKDHDLLILHYLRFDPAIRAGSHIVTTSTKKSMRVAGTNMWLPQEIYPRPCTTQNRTEKPFRLM